MDKIKVDKGIEIPKTDRGWGNRDKYPFADMSVGDSFFVPAMPESTKNGLYSISKRYRIRIVSRKVTENRVGGYRVWRVE